MNTKEIVKTANLPIKEESINSLMDKFISSLDVAESSKQTYRRQLKSFIEWIKAEGIINPEREDILRYKQSLFDRDIAPLSITGYITAVRKFFSWTETIKLYPNIAKDIKGAKRSRGFKKESLTIEQIKTLLQNIDRDSIQGKRDFALLNLLVRTGLRTIEVIRADVQDIRQEGGEAVLYIQGKGRDEKDEFVLLTEETLNPILDYLSLREIEETAPLFASLSNKNMDQALTTRSVSRIVKEHLKGIGLNNGRLTAHSLRHTAITLSLLGGASIQEAQVLGRHASIDTTLIYAHNINRVNNAPERKIDEVLSGLN